MKEPQQKPTENIKVKQSKLSYLLIVVLLILGFLFVLRGQFSLTDLKAATDEKDFKTLAIDPSLKSPFLSDGQEKGKEKIEVLCYHDVIPDSEEKRNPTDTKIKNLKMQFEYLRANGYKVLSLDEYIKIAEGEQTAPKKSVLLTFDGGESGFYKYVYPILKEYRYHAVVAVAGAKVGTTDSYKTYLTWDQLREMEKSKLVDTASHTYDMYGQKGTNTLDNYGSPSAQCFWSKEDSYEDDEDYIQRMRKDLKKAQKQMKKELDHPSRAIVWPDGKFNQIGLTVARKNEFEVSMTMLEGDNFSQTPQATQFVRRNLCEAENQNEMACLLTEQKRQQMYKELRGAQISITDLYDKNNPAATEENIDKLIKKLKKNRINTVFLQTYDNNGVYFKTDHAPVIKNIYNTIAGKLVRNDFFVYAAMPTFSASWLMDPDEKNRVNTSENQNAEWYKRVSPFSEEAVKELELLYADFAKQAIVNGILFQDDLYLNQYEDFSSHGKGAYYREFEEELDEGVFENKAKLQKWQKWKCDYLIKVSQRLMKKVRIYRPFALSMRDLHGDVAADEKKSGEFAQDYSIFLKTYDVVVIVAYPYLTPDEELNVASEDWLDRRLDTIIKKTGKNPKQIIFRVQTDDLDKNYLTSFKKYLEDYGVNHIIFFPGEIK